MFAKGRVHTEQRDLRTVCVNYNCLVLSNITVANNHVTDENNTCTMVTVRYTPRMVAAVGGLDEFKIRKCTTTTTTTTKKNWLQISWNWHTVYNVPQHNKTYPDIQSDQLVHWRLVSDPNVFASLFDAPLKCSRKKSDRNLSRGGEGGCQVINWTFPPDSQPGCDQESRVNVHKCVQVI